MGFRIVDGGHVDSVFFGVTSGMTGGEVKEVFAVRKKPWEAMSGVLPGVEGGGRSDGSALGADTHERAQVVGGVEDDIVGAPSGAAPVRGVGHPGDSAAAGGDLHQLAVGEEPEVAAVRRPEGMARTLSAFELSCEIAVEWTNPESLRVRRVRDKGHSVALRGEDRHAADIACGIEGELVWSRKFGVEGLHDDCGFGKVSREGG